MFVATKNLNLKRVFRLYRQSRRDAITGAQQPLGASVGTVSPWWLFVISVPFQFNFRAKVPDEFVLVGSGAAQGIADQQLRLSRLQTNCPAMLDGLFQATISLMNS